jgi:hypothetical protein
VYGVSGTTSSTNLQWRIISDLSAQFMTVGPFVFKISASEQTPTTRISPKAFDYLIAL